MTDRRQVVAALGALAGRQVCPSCRRAMQVVGPTQYWGKWPRGYFVVDGVLWHCKPCSLRPAKPRRRPKGRWA